MERARGRGWRGDGRGEGRGKKIITSSSRTSVPLAISGVQRISSAVANCMVEFT